MDNFHGCMLFLLFTGKVWRLQGSCNSRYLATYVLLKALPPVCMKYTARDESGMANIARGEAKCYICHKTLIKSCILHTNEAAVF